MTPMFQAIRTAAVLLLTAIVSAGSAFAPEHAHERDDHHPKATVHRHFAPHHARHGSDARLDDDDDHVIWLTTAWLQADVYRGPGLVSTPAIWCGFAPTIVQWGAIVLDDAVPPHGPPRTSRSPRAPPFHA
jgi:hypothetical protein